MASSGRFQSQLFSVLSQRSLKWRDRLQRLVRQAKLASLWGVQMAIYPIYVVFQTGRVLDRQLQKASRRIAPPLQAAKHTLQRLGHPQPTPPPPQPDTPIRQVLHAAKVVVPSALLRSLHVATQRSPVSTSDPIVGAIIPAAPTSLVAGESATLTIAPPTQLIHRPGLDTREDPLGDIQGIASLLSTRSLVLTTSHNHVLDILTADQQQHLRQQISWELAVYYHHRRQIRAIAPRIPQILPLPADRPNLLPPVRAFRRLMAWMQTSDIALATNVFQEVALVYGRRQKPWTIAPMESAPVSSQSFGAPLTRSIPDHLPKPWMHPDASEPRMFFQPTPLPGTPIAAPKSSPLPIEHPVAPSSASPLPVSTSQPKVAEVAQVVDASEERKAIALTPYIDTKATLVKYEKHPLEQLLLWLDSGMLWIEEKVAQVFRWFGNLLN
ncbi:MAG: hypothetical protein HC881_08720 [Leptolyngbyaceae cyanobacterium SL_7_1]|nr:hypothetical protein [Leptolyngbyaceae cyanobacterium SL_7_1]